MKTFNKYQKPFIVIFVAVLLSVVSFYLQTKKPVSVITKAPEVIRENLMWGQPAKQMFPALNNPEYISSGSVDFLKNDDEVFVIKMDGKSYVYPANILSFHHVVNNDFSEGKAAITYCELTDSAVMYKSTVDGLALDLAALGPLYLGNLVMYDRQTDSYWIQLTGEAFSGKLAGKKLQRFKQIVRTKWSTVKNEANTLVLKPPTNMDFYNNFYNKNKKNMLGYNAYLSKRQPDDKLKSMDQFTEGIGVTLNGYSKFYPLNQLLSKSIIADQMGNDQFKLTLDNNADVVFENKGAGNLEFTKIYWYAWYGLYPQTKVFTNN